jgi:hypothetical protein
MPFIIPELVLESVIRDGIQNCKDNPDAVINDVFGNLTRAFSEKKYGVSELQKIKTLIQTKQIPVVYAWHMVEASAKPACISIQLLSEQEDERRASFGDFLGNVDEEITDSDSLAALILTDTFTPDSYDTTSGTVTVPDSVDLSQIHVNLLFVDSDGTEFTILGGIDNTIGNKKFVIEKGQIVALGAGALIKSSIDFQRHQVKGNTENVQMIVGIHSRDPLTTKYLYTLVKYFIMSRRNSLSNRDLELATYKGSDFTRDMNYGADAIFTRFLTVSGMINNDYNSSLVDLYDHVNVTVKTQKDVYNSEELGLDDQTTQTTE